MSSNIDERVVSMKFNNGQFQTGIKQTMDSLANLKSGLNLDASKKGLDDLAASGRNFSLANLADGVDGVSAKFIAMSTIAITALASIANKAIEVGIQVAKSLTVDPVKAGFDEYELKMGSIQTIMAGSGASLEEVNSQLQELNEYSDKTIYSFADMTQSIGKFTNAGVSLDRSVAAIQGVANVAAISGANATQASAAMYNFGQALSAGHVKLIDWKSIELAGMATVEFKNQLIDSAVAAGTLTREIDGTYKTLEGTPVTATKGFNESLQDQWLTADALTTTLGRYADATTAIGARATAAASDVKTFSMLMSTLKESAGSGWATTSEIIFGDFEEAKTLWTGVNDVIGGILNDSADARNAMLNDWDQLGGRTSMIDAVRNAFDALMSVITPIKEAFRAFFPATTGQDLFNITEAIRKLTESLILSDETASKVKRIFAGVFAFFEIGVEIIKNLFGVFGDLTGEMDGAGGGVLDFLASIGDFLVRMNVAIKTSESFAQFFVRLRDVLAKPIDLLRQFSGWVRETFDSMERFSADGMEESLDGINERLSPLQALGNAVSVAWENMGRVFSRIWELARPIVDAMREFFGDLGTAMAESMDTMDFGAVLDLINTGLFAGLVVIIKKFLDDGIDIGGSGFLGSIKDSFDQLTGTLTAMQNQLKADTLMKIASAIGILTLSVVALSLIDSAKLAKALTAITIMFVQLGGALAMFQKISAAGSFVKLPAAAAALMLLSTAILILTGAVAVLAQLEWEELAKGLVGVTVLLLALAGAGVLLSKAGPGLIPAGLGMIAVAAATKILASAVQDFADISWEEIGRGLTGMAGALAVIVGAMALITPSAVLSAGGVLIISGALVVIADVLETMGNLEWEVVGRGLSALGGSLAIIAGAMAVMTSALPGAAALLIVAGALVVMTDVLKKMGKLEWITIGKSMVALAGSLLIIAGAMALMVEAIPGALALLVVSAALAILAPILVMLGDMEWEEIGKGLITLAGALAIIGLAGLVLTPVVPTIFALGLAIGALGIGILAAGVGVLAFATALTALSIIGPVAAVSVVAILTAVISLIPMAIQALGEGIILFAGVIAEGGPTLVSAMVTLLESLIEAIVTIAPQAVQALVDILFLMLDAIIENLPQFMDKGAEIIAKILEGIARNIGTIIAAGVKVIVAFLEGVGNAMPQIMQAAWDLIIDFLEALALTIRKNMGMAVDAGLDVGEALVDGIIDAIGKGAGRITSKLYSIINPFASSMEGQITTMVANIKNTLKVKSPSKVMYEIGDYATEGFLLGIENKGSKIAEAGNTLGSTAIKSLKDSMRNTDSVISSGMSLTPTIKPVLDLSTVKKDASLIDGILAPSTINTNASYNKAASVAADARSAQQDMSGSEFDNSSVTGETFTLNQYNNSPKALSNGEIYRQTKNALSVKKGRVA